MATAQSTLTGARAQPGYSDETLARTDAAETILQSVDKSTIGTTGISLFHLLTFASIGGSIALYFTGSKKAGIFVGLWPPTFQALKAVVDKNSQPR
jgi:hypothetical protein